MKNGYEEAVKFEDVVMKCRNCGEELRAEPAITEPGWIIFHECIFKGATEKEVIENFARKKP